MLGSSHLWEPSRPSAVLLVAARAEHCGIGKNGFYAGIFRVLRERSVAGLAIYVRMFAGLLFIENVAMARFACFVTGVGDGKGSDFGDGIRAVMTVFAEAFGDEVGAKGKKGENAHQKDASDAQQMFGVSESIHIRNGTMHVASHKTKPFRT